METTRPAASVGAAATNTMSLPMGLVWRFAAASLIGGIGFSLIMPLAVVRLAQQGYGAASIGFFALLPFLVLTLCIPFTVKLRNRVGRGRTFFFGQVLGIGPVIGFAVTDSYALWCLFGVVGGLYAAALWGLTDTLIAENAPPDRVGSVTGSYQTLVAGALTLGPALPITLSLDFETGSRLAVALMAASFIPTATLGLRAIDAADHTDGITSVLRMFRAAPTLVGAAFLGGLFESGVNAMGALHALRLGFGSASAALVVAVIAAGSLLAQYPLGKLTDRIAMKPLLLAACLILLASSALLPLATAYPSLLWVVAATWGAFGGGLYTLILVHIAKAYRGTGVAAASIVTLMAYTVGGMVGPGLGGVVTEIAPGHGLAVMLVLLSAIMVGVIALGRDLRTAENRPPSSRNALAR